MKVPKINWISFDKNNPPANLYGEVNYLILLKDDEWSHGKTWKYNVDIASPYGSYIDDFWDTENDWLEGNQVEVVAYAEFPYGLKECDLIEDFYY